MLIYYAVSRISCKEIMHAVFIGYVLQVLHFVQHFQSELIMKEYQKLEKYGYISSTLPQEERCKRCCFHRDSDECFKANCVNGFIVNVREYLLNGSENEVQ